MGEEKKKKKKKKKKQKAKISKNSEKITEKKIRWCGVNSTKKDKKTGGKTLPNFRQYYSNQDGVVVLVQKQIYRQMENNRESRNKPDTYGQLIFNKGGKNKKWGKVSSASGTGKAGQLHANQ